MGGEAGICDIVDIDVVGRRLDEITAVDRTVRLCRQGNIELGKRSRELAKKAQSVARERAQKPEETPVGGRKE